MKYSPQEANRLVALCTRQLGEGGPQQLFILRRGSVEFATLGTAVRPSSKQSGRDAASEAGVLRPRLGVPSYYTFDVAMSNCRHSVRLSDADSRASAVSLGARGSAFGAYAPSSGYHCWTVAVSPADFDSVSIGVVSLVGVENFSRTGLGLPPPSVACIKHGSRPYHRIHWTDENGMEDALEPAVPFRYILDQQRADRGEGWEAEVSVAVDFVHQQVAFYLSGVLLGCVPSRDLTGAHTVFVYFTEGASARLAARKPCVYLPLAADTQPPAVSGAPRYLAGNPYARWERGDGAGVEATFELPLGMCWSEHHALLFISDRAVIRSIDPRNGAVQSHVLRVQPEGALQVELLGGVCAVGDVLYVSELRSQVMLCIDPSAWTARVVAKGHGDRGFAPDPFCDVAPALRVIHAYDTAHGCHGSAFGGTMPQRDFAGVRDAVPPFEFGPLGMCVICETWLFVCDSRRHAVFGWNTAEAQPEVCILCGSPGQPDNRDGWNTDTRFRCPTSICADPFNANHLSQPQTLWLADTGNDRVCKLQIHRVVEKGRWEAQVTTVVLSLCRPPSAPSLSATATSGLSVSSASQARRTPSAASIRSRASRPSSSRLRGLSDQEEDLVQLRDPVGIVCLPAEDSSQGGQEGAKVVLVADSSSCIYAAMIEPPKRAAPVREGEITESMLWKMLVLWLLTGRRGGSGWVEPGFREVPASSAVRQATLRDLVMPNDNQPKDHAFMCAFPTQLLQLAAKTNNVEVLKSMFKNFPGCASVAELRKLQIMELRESYAVLQQEIDRLLQQEAGAD